MFSNDQAFDATNETVKPLFFRLQHKQDSDAFNDLRNNQSSLCVHDEIEGQLRELIKSAYPSVKIKMSEYPYLIEKHLNGTDIKKYGAWVYYPWSKKIIHLLDEAEFVEVRTNRNRYKITREEQHLLSKKIIGIVGLSVGQSIALTMAMERTCGELRLADFDVAELSNLNRLRTGLHNLGLRKTVIAAREISEIDPYLKVTLFNDGLTRDNIEQFFTTRGKMDLLVEVCDGLDVKILSRFKARELKIPVIMDTNDRGMVDVERFDLEPERPILHGLAGDLDPDKISNLSNEDKIPYILKMIGADSISTRLKSSMLEVEQSINTWPQLASSVALGGAVTTDVCRSIFLNRFHDSGRYYIDLDQIFKDHEHADQTSGQNYDGPLPLDSAHAECIALRYSSVQTSVDIGSVNLERIIQAACLAPSGGNAQPWKFQYRNNSLYIFHDPSYSYSLLDYNNLGSYIAFGAMLENIEITANTMGLSVEADVFPLKDDFRLIAVVPFANRVAESPRNYLAAVIGSRITNRNVTVKKLLDDHDEHALTAMASTIPGAVLQLFKSEEHLQEFSEILSNTERLRFLHPRGHYDTFVKELRFTREEVESTADGLDINTLNISQGDIAALQIARDPAAIHFLHQMHKGSGFKKLTAKNVSAASSIGVLSMDGQEARHFLQGGRALERVWLEANHRGIAFQPVAQIIFMAEQLLAHEKSVFNAYEQSELLDIHTRFSKITDLRNGRFPVFVFRLCYADVPRVRSLRKPVNQVMI